MRRIVIVLVISLFSITILPAQENSSPVPKSRKWNGVFSSTAGNRYVGTTICAVFANQTVVQSKLDLARMARATTFTFTVWNSTGITPSTAFKTDAYETDVDINVAHRFGTYDISAGGWMFFLNPTAKTDVLVGDLKISRNFTNGKNFFTPFTEVQWYGTTKSTGSGLHGGIYPMFGVAFNRPISERTRFSSEVHTNYDVSGGFSKRQGSTMLAMDTSLGFSITKPFTIIAHTGFVGSFDDPRRPWIPVFNLGISHSF